MRINQLPLVRTGPFQIQLWYVAMHREPVFRKSVATDRGTFTSTTELDPERHQLLLFDTHTLVNDAGEHSSDYRFVMRCWTKSELESGRQHGDSSVVVRAQDIERISAFEAKHDPTFNRADAASRRLRRLVRRIGRGASMPRDCRAVVWCDSRSTPQMKLRRVFL
jgi:hypothetical protein